MPTSVHCCRFKFNLAQRFLLPHCALPHQSAHTGGATNECSRGFTILKQMGDKIFLSKKEKKLCFIIYILSLYYLNCSILSNVFLPSCPMYWWSVSSGYMLLNPTEKKMHDFLSRKVFACVLWSNLSASPLALFSFPLRWTTRPYAMNPSTSLMKLSLYCSISLYFISVCLCRFDCFSETYREREREKKRQTCLFCVVTVMVMQVITVLLKWTSEPVKAFEGKITYIALTS